MTTQPEPGSDAEETNPDQISRYLSSHPEFFDDHPNLVAELRLSHSSGKAVSLVERQIQVLRDQNKELKRKLLELIDVARDNDRLNQRMHQLTLDLLKADSIGVLLSTLDDHLRNEFNVDEIRVHLVGYETEPNHDSAALRLDIDESIQELFKTAFSENRPQCGRLSQQQLEFLFQDQATTIRSAVVVPLGVRAEYGLLAIGNREAHRFSAGMDTLFMSHLGELLGGFLQHRNGG